MENTEVAAEKHLRHIDAIEYSAGSLSCIAWRNVAPHFITRLLVPSVTWYE